MKSAFNSKVRKWTLLGLAVLAAIRLYQVQEMIVALAIFSILFALVAGTVLTLFLLDRAGQRTLVWAAPRTMHFAETARHSLALTAELSRRALRHLHSHTAQTETEKKD
jgi:uncharacterized membrane protein YraQ (UPF0718 family)